MNPLQRREDHFEKDDPGRRRAWFNCACCPPNIMRLLASLDHYLATVSADTLYVHQYAGSRLSAADLDLEVTTDYPWSGAVYLRVLAAPAAERGIALRIPAWSAHTRISVNGESHHPGPGYRQLRRRWQAGDGITLHMDLTPRWTHPDRRVDAVRGCVAIERGPLVYCFEQADQAAGVHVDDLAVRPSAVLGERPVTLPGIGQTIEVTAGGVHLPAAASRPPRSRSRTSSGTTGTDAPCGSGSPARIPPSSSARRTGIPGRSGPGARRPGRAGAERVGVGGRVADVAPGLAGGERRRAELLRPRWRAAPRPPPGRPGTPGPWPAGSGSCACTRRPIPRRPRHPRCAAACSRSGPARRTRRPPACPPPRTRPRTFPAPNRRSWS